jgi:PD-(D/E)XK nuclease superfamily protein
MKNFLDHIIDEIDVNDLISFRNSCYVFPTQRACRHFENLLQQRFGNQVFWAPSLLSIQEFVQHLNPQLRIASEIQLITELYTVYKKEEAETSFEEFYSWGKILLKDFDEIDRYLVDAKLIYKNLQDIKDLDHVFGPDEEALKAIIEFQKVIDISGKGKLFAEFNSTWDTVGKAYFLLQEALTKKGLAYDGMLYRNAAMAISDENSIPFKKVTFAGFNALSLAEETIFSALLSRGTGHLYFDVDRFYFNKQNFEASKFLNRYKHIWQGENVHWIDANGFNSERTIDVFGTSLGVTQTKIASNILTSNANYNPSKTAVVLADESLLSPVLYALPKTEQPINITMGKPVINHAIGEFIKLYFEYQARIDIQKKEIVIPVDVLKALASNTIIQQENDSLLKWLGKTKQSHISWSWLTKFEKLSTLAMQAFTPIEGAIQLFDISLGLLEKINSNYSESTNDALTSVLYEELSKLKSELLLVDNTFEISFINKIVLESLSVLKVPLGKETGNGLQVMGFLETRTLDFENLIILSVNEHFLPASSSNKSFIPFGLRKAFKMPHFTEQDSIYAYHFYRLMQRSKNVSLIYNTELTVDGSGEKSRYILQLAHRIKSEGFPITINESTVSIPLAINSLNPREIRISKSDKIIKDVENLLFEGSKERPMSPTLVLDYIECPLRFYLKRIRKLKKEEDTTNEIDAREFGNIVHHTMQLLYEPFLGKPISKEDILALKTNKLSNQINQVFERELDLKSFTGKNEYQRYIITNTLERLLEKDAAQAPFILKGLEFKLDSSSFNLALSINGNPIQLGGIIDRLDELPRVNGTPLTRVIDYKTGKVEMQKPEVYKKPVPIDDYVDNYFTKPDFKVEFQSYYYALIYNRNHPNEHITAGIYGLKTIGAGVLYVRNRAQPIPNEIFDLFENRLILLFEEILNPKIDFCQTKETKACRYCEFNAICGR